MKGKKKNRVGKPIDSKYKLFHYHAERIISNDPALKSYEVIAKIYSFKKDMAEMTPISAEEHFQIPKDKQPYKIIANYREKLNHTNGMIPSNYVKVRIRSSIEKKLDEIILLLKEMNK